MTGLLLTTTAGFATCPDGTKTDPEIFTAICSIDYVNINLLLDSGMNIDTVDHQGNTPLMLAAKIGNPRILDIVLAHNPLINKTNDEGTTALMIAAKTGQFHIVKKLVQHQADISMQDRNWDTAITLASRYGHQDVVRFLQGHQNQRALHLQ